MRTLNHLTGQPRPKRDPERMSASTTKSGMIPCVIYFFDDRNERKIIVLSHIIFILDLVLLFLDFSTIRYIIEFLYHLIFQASILSVLSSLFMVR